MSELKTILFNTVSLIGLDAREQSDKFMEHITLHWEPIIEPESRIIIRPEDK